MLLPLKKAHPSFIQFSNFVFLEGQMLLFELQQYVWQSLKVHKAR